MESWPDAGRGGRGGHVDGEVKRHTRHATRVPGLALVPSGMRHRHVAQEQHSTACVRIEALPITTTGTTVLRPARRPPATRRPLTHRPCGHHPAPGPPVALCPHLLHQPTGGQLGLAMGGLPPGDLRLGVAGGLAGNTQALAQPHGEVAGLQLHHWGDAHQAVGRHLHQAEVREARRLGAEESALC